MYTEHCSLYRAFFFVENGSVFAQNFPNGSVYARKYLYEDKYAFFYGFQIKEFQ